MRFIACVSIILTYCPAAWASAGEGKIVFRLFQKENTVKLGYNEHGYNEHGYNEHPVITNKMNTVSWFQSF